MTEPSFSPVNILMILDGWGINPSGTDNAVALAKTPFLDHLLTHAPHCTLACSGEAVGLPPGTMGNSEVGHMNIGAGRQVPQDLMRINQAVADRSFFHNPALKTAMETVRDRGTTLHLLGLLSDGGVHSHIRHLFALLDMAEDIGLKAVRIHPILDGRDTPPRSGITYMRQLCDHIANRDFAKIATLAGRFWTMDRDTRWDRVKKAHDLLTKGQGSVHADPVRAVRHAYDQGETDEFVSPVLIRNSGDPATGPVKDGDGIIFFNFRADRAKEITRAFTQADFNAFERDVIPQLSAFVTMTRYDETLDLPAAFGPQRLTRIFGEVLSSHGIPQLRIAETEKYAHVTYFFNGGEETAFKGEERILIPSPRDVATYDLKPAMSAQAVARKACGEIKSGKHRFVVLNFANMDMVGHTGILPAAVRACETVDQCVKMVTEAIWDTGGTAFITADHGNSEQMKAADGTPHTAHTLNPVRFILARKGLPPADLKDGILGDIAPTILKVLELTQPNEMTGTSLIRDEV